MTEKHTQPAGATTAAPKDNTALIVVIVVVGLVVLPLVVVGGIIFAIFGFVGDIMNSDLMQDLTLEFEDIMKSALVSPILPEHQESIRNVYAIADNDLITAATISKKDCLTLGYLTAYADEEVKYDDWFTAFCESEDGIYIATEKYYDDDKVELHLFDAEQCAIATLTTDLSRVLSYKRKSTCSGEIAYRLVVITDTSEDVTELPDDFFEKYSTDALDELREEYRSRYEGGKV